MVTADEEGLELTDPGSSCVAFVTPGQVIYSVCEPVNSDDDNSASQRVKTVT